MFAVNITSSQPRELIMTISYRGMQIDLIPTQPARAIEGTYGGKQGHLHAHQSQGWFSLDWNDREINVESRIFADPTGDYYMKSIIPSTPERIASLLKALLEWERLAPVIQEPMVAIRPPSRDSGILTIALLGESRVGKDAFVHKLKTGLFLTHHEPTPGHALARLDILTSIGPINVVTLSMGNQEQVCSYALLDPATIAGAIIMYDSTKPETWMAISKWKSILTDRKINCPTLIVGNKIDLIPDGIELKPQNSTHKLISVGRGEGLMDVMMTLLRAIKKDPTIMNL